MRPNDSFKRPEYRADLDHESLPPPPRKVGRPPKDKSLQAIKKEELLQKREAQKQKMDALKIEFGTLTN
jgi:hypothetical protein